MAQNRHEISIKSEGLAPNLGEIAVGCSYAITNELKLIQMVRFRSNQIIIRDTIIWSNKWGQL